MTVRISSECVDRIYHFRFLFVVSTVTRSEDEEEKVAPPLKAVKFDVFYTRTHTLCFIYNLFLKLLPTYLVFLLLVVTRDAKYFKNGYTNILCVCVCLTHGL